MSKIKTFKEFIKESVWADLHSRGIGETEREEDDINALDAEGFYHYINDHYSFNNGALTMGNPGGPFIIAVPVVNSGRFMVHYLILWSDSVRFEISNSIKSNVEFIELLEKEYTVKPMEPVDNPTSEYINILPKDGSEVTNRFFIEVLDFFIANIEKHTQGEYLNVEKIQVNESVWGDLHSRGIGELEREEYNVNFLGRKGFYEYMKEHYGEKIKDIDVRLDNYWAGGLNVHTYIIQAGMCIDSIYDRNENITRLLIYPSDDEKTTLADIEPPALKKRFKVTHSEFLNYADNITEKDDTCTNQTYIDLVELILDHFSLKVNESVWGDLHSRGIGETEREEDDVNFLDLEGMCEYLNSHYKIKYTFIIIDEKYNQMIIPIVYYRFFLYYISVDFTKHLISVKDDLFLALPDLKDIIEKEFKLSKYEDQYIKFRIEPKDGSETTNRFLLDVIDFINSKISTQKKCLIKKRLNESVWGDLHSRGIGETEREEDDINLLDENDFEKYLQDHYNVINGYSIYSLGDITVPVLKSSFADERPFALIYDGMYQDGIEISDDLQDYYPQLYKELQKEFVLSHRGSMFNITPKSGEKCTNKFCIEVLDFIINNAKKDLIIEKR